MEYYRIGCIVRPHGVHGMLKLLPLTDDVNRFRDLCDAFLEQNGQYRPIRVAHVSVQQDAVFLQVEGIQTREDAEQVRDQYICVDRAHAVELPPFTYFIADLIGCQVSDTLGRAYGTITDVLQTGANDVYVISGEKPMLVPALKKVLHEVDIEHKTMILEHTVLKEVALFED